MMEWYDILNLVAVLLIALGNAFNTFLSTKKMPDVKIAKKLQKVQAKEAKLVEAYNNFNKNS